MNNSESIISTNHSQTSNISSGDNNVPKLSFRDSYNNRVEYMVFPYVPRTPNRQQQHQSRMGR